MQFLTGQYLIDPAGPQFRFGWASVALMVLFPAMWFAYAHYVEATSNRRAPLPRLARRLRGISILLSLAGLVYIAFRAGDARIPLIGSRLLFYLIVLAQAALWGYLVYFLRTVFPAKEAEYEAKLLRRQYQPRSRRRR